MTFLLAVLIAVLCWIVIGKGIIMMINHPDFNPIIVLLLMYFLLFVGYLTK